MEVHDVGANLTPEQLDTAVANKCQLVNDIYANADLQAHLDVIYSFVRDTADVEFPQQQQ